MIAVYWAARHNGRGRSLSDLPIWLGGKIEICSTLNDQATS